MQVGEYDMKEISSKRVWAGFVGMLGVGFAILVAMHQLSMPLDWFIQACAVIILASLGALVAMYAYESATWLRKRMGMA